MVGDTSFSQKIDRFIVCYDDGASFDSDAICTRETLSSLLTSHSGLFLLNYSLVKMGMRDKDVVSLLYIINWNICFQYGGSIEPSIKKDCDTSCSQAVRRGTYMIAISTKTYMSERLKPNIPNHSRVEFVIFIVTLLRDVGNYKKSIMTRSIY